VLLEAGGLTDGREGTEAREMWAAVLREAPRMHTPLDEVWLDRVLVERAAPRTELTRDVNAAEAGSVERSQDWGEAPDAFGFVGRAEELATLREWVVDEHIRLAAVLGMGGIGKTALASRVALEPGQREGRYRNGLAGYGALLRAMGETRHQSCLVVTSREAPPELAVLGRGAVRRFQLGGLGVAEGQVLLADKELSGTDQDWANLIARFGGNGLALKVVGESIRQVFDGNLGAFLDQPGSRSIFGGIRRLLAEQIKRSSALEQKLLRVLAVEREPVRLAELITEVGPRVRQATVLEAVEALRRACGCCLAVWQPSGSHTAGAGTPHWPARGGAVPAQARPGTSRPPQRRLVGIDLPWTNWRPMAGDGSVRN
jgi:hypothetical protein